MLKKLQEISLERAREKDLVPDIKLIKKREHNDIGPLLTIKNVKPVMKKMDQLLKIEISLRKCERVGVFNKK